MEIASGSRLKRLAIALSGTARTAKAVDPKARSIAAFVPQSEMSMCTTKTEMNRTGIPAIWLMPAGAATPV